MGDVHIMELNEKSRMRDYIYSSVHVKYQQQLSPQHVL